MNPTTENVRLPYSYAIMNLRGCYIASLLVLRLYSHFKPINYDFAFLSPQKPHFINTYNTYFLHPSLSSGAKAFLAAEILK